MSKLTSTTLCKTFPTRSQLFFTSFIIFFTFIFLLNGPSISNHVRSTSIATLTTPHISSPRNNISTYAIANERGREALSLSRVENGPSSCDMFDGRWIYDDSRPAYAPGKCPYIGLSFNCYKSGRPDFSYFQYRWQPYGCDIPRFDGKKFMEMLRGKKMVFAGDSLSRNMWESLICSLHALNINGTRTLKPDVYSTFVIKEYNCSISLINAPFLIKHWKNAGPTTIQTYIKKLRLDEMHENIAMFHDADFLIFNTGQWWRPFRMKNGENIFQEGDDFVHGKLDLEEAYTKAMNTWANWIDNTVNMNKAKVFFLGLTAVHFKGGDWNTNGTCEATEPIKKTEPIKGEIIEPYGPWIKTTPELVMSKMKTPVVYLNITRLTEYRRDGHPSTYWSRGTRFQNDTRKDCMHWCLPGVPDTWNQLLYASMLSSFEGRV